MVRILSCLLLLIILKANNVYSQETCQYVWVCNGNSTNGNNCRYEAICQTACQDYTESQTQSCPTNYTGQIIQTRNYYCQTKTYSAWQTISNTCTANIPSCQTSTETQTLSCQTGYTGAIFQTRSSICSDPYGQPSWGAWVTLADTCVKSVTNATNVLSPISPISVLNQSINTPALTTQSVPATVQPQTNVPTEITTPTQTDTKTESTANSPRANNTINSLIKFEVITQPSIKQYDLFPIISIGQPIPESIRRNQDLYFQFIQGESVDFGGEQDMRMNAIKQFTLEYENGFE